MLIHDRVLNAPLAVDIRGKFARVVIAADKYTVANLSAGINDREAYATLFARSVDMFMALRRLVACPDLCLDEMEPETRVALDQAEGVLFGIDNDVSPGAMLPPQFCPRERATVLAALRYWQRHQANAVGRATQVLPEDEIATDRGEINPMRADEIDALCERINIEV